MKISSLGIRPGSIVEMEYSGKLGRARIVAISSLEEEYPIKVEWLRLDWQKESEGAIDFHKDDEWSEDWKLCEAETVTSILERYNEYAEDPNPLNNEM